MKNKFFKMLLICILIFQSCIIINSRATVAGGMETIKGKYSFFNESNNEVKKISLGSNLECVLKIKYLPEFIRSSGDSSNPLYGRSVIIGISFYHNKSGTTGKKILSHTMRVTFTYDKKSLVYIDDKDNDISFRDVRSEEGGRKWKIADTHEILDCKNTCIVSEMLTVFKIEKLTNKVRYIENSHQDVMCTSEGNIAINCKCL